MTSTQKYTLTPSLRDALIDRLILIETEARLKQPRAFIEFVFRAGWLGMNSYTDRELAQSLFNSRNNERILGFFNPGALVLMSDWLNQFKTVWGGVEVRLGISDIPPEEEES